jgi:hypothetical protein
MPFRLYFAGQDIIIFETLQTLEVFVAVIMKNAFFWYVASCGCQNRCFGATFSSTFRVERIRELGAKLPVKNSYRKSFF